MHDSIKLIAAAAFLFSTLGASAAEDHPGRHFFEDETFGGNGRTCQSCHLPGTRTISPEEARALFAEDPMDPLFQGDASDEFGRNAVVPCLDAGVASVACEPTFERFLEHATIVVGIDLHEAVSVVGSDARTVFVNRGIPSSADTPALVLELMADGRAPSLEEQARGALSGHANVHEVDDEILEAIAAFETTEFSSPTLEAFAHGGPEPELPEGPGRDFFVKPAAFGKDGFCGACHSGPMLNEVAINLTVPGNDNVPLTVRKGSRFSSAIVSERNAIGNPLLLWSILGEDGSVRSIVSPDIGRAAITGHWSDVNEFKIPSLWNVRNTAPYFHDNSAKTLEEVVEHYANFLAPTFQFVMTEEEKADILAFLKLL